MRLDGVTARGKRLGLAAAGAVLLSCAGGCGGRPSLYQRLQRDQFDVTTRAVVEAGERREMKAAPYLVDRLEHESPSVRMGAIGSLRRITGQDLAYSWYGPEPERREAVKRWRQWLQQQGLKPPGQPDGE